MAEVAGLVISGVGLAALFDSCMNAFEYVESGSKYGREYNKAALKISLLQLRLTRWKETVQFVEDDTAAQWNYNNSLIASPAESEKVRELLGHIEDEFQEAERRSKKFHLKEPPVVLNLERTDTTIAALTKKVQKLALTRQKAASMRQKASWALHDRVKFERLIEDQTGYINDLVDLFPAMEIKIKTQDLADSEATTLAEPATKEESKAESLAILKEAAKDVDPVLEKAAAKVQQQGASGHLFAGTINVSDTGRMMEGDFVGADYKGPFLPGSEYTGVANVTGNARSMRGNTYNGKSIWDD